MNSFAENAGKSSSLRDFAARTLIATIIVAVVGGLIVLVWVAVKVVLIFFAAVLFGIFLRMAAVLISRATHLGSSWSFAIAVVALLMIGGGVGWLLAGPITNQIHQLKNQLPDVIQHDEEALKQYSWGRAIENHLRNAGDLLAQTGGVLEKIKKIFSVSFQGAVYLLVILFGGFYLGMQSQYYARGFLRLLPPAVRPRVRTAMNQIGSSLRYWLLGQITSMIIIGCLTWLGLHLLRVPGATVIGVLAGILDFVPVLGTFTAAVAGCIFALLKSWTVVLYVVCLFVGLRLLEDQVITPVVQRRAAKLPPGLTILSMFLFSELFGLVGLLLATPLLALILAAVRTLYLDGIIENPAFMEPSSNGEHAVVASSR